jgi:hypothetical protein
MAYNITLTNGTPLLTLQDGTEDSTTTSLNLIGRNYTGFGLFFNENFVHLLEHFSSATAPINPLVGQLWWDSTNKHLSVWQGTNWKAISSSQTGATSPPNPIVGDFWWNPSQTQFYVYSGTSWIPIGPYTANVAPATSSLAQFNVVDNTSTTHYVGNVTVNNKFTGVFSSDSVAFTPASPALVGGLATIYPGLNLPGAVAAANVTANLTTTSNLTVTNSANIANNLAVGGNLTVGSNLTVGGQMTVSGNVTFTGNLTFPSNPGTFANISSSITPSANLSYNLGSVNNWWNNIYGTSIHAQYADLAERFEADAVYDPGTVVELGGTAEITAAVNDLSEDVFGVISTRAAFVMNSRVGDDLTHPPIAVQGRVPVKVIGTVRKGDRLVSAGNGLARAGSRSEITTWNVIGRSLENKDTLGEGTVEAVVKLNS